MKYPSTSWLLVAPAVLKNPEKMNDDGLLLSS